MEQDLVQGRAGARYSAAANLIFLIAAYFLVAAASFNGFYDKWQFADDSKRFPLTRTLEGTSERPSVYRQFVPDIANAAERLLPAIVKSRIASILHSSDGMLRTKIRSPMADNPRYILRYHVVYYATFLFLFFSLFVLRNVCLHLGAGVVAATLAPMAMALLLPVFQTGGGFYYDFSELFFMASAVRLCLTRRAWLLFPLVLLATWNKESFVAFILTLYPLLEKTHGKRGAIVIVGASVLLSAAVYANLWFQFRYNSARVDFHLWGNILYYLNPINLFSLEVNYGIVMAKGSALLVMAGIVLIAALGWPDLPGFVRKHIVFAAVINIPLYFLFDGLGEVRALSMLYVGLVLLMAMGLSRWAAGTQMTAIGYKSRAAAMKAAFPSDVV